MERARSPGSSAPPGLPWAQPCPPRPHGTHPSRHLCRGGPEEEEEEEESAEAAVGGSSPRRSWRGRGREILGKENTSESESRPHPSSWKEVSVSGLSPCATTELSKSVNWARGGSEGHQNHRDCDTPRNADRRLISKEWGNPCRCRAPSARKGSPGGQGGCPGCCWRCRGRASPRALPGLC